MNIMHPRFHNGRNKTVCIRLPEDLIKVLKKLAKERGHGFSSFLQDGLDQWAKAHEGK